MNKNQESVEMCYGRVDLYEALTIMPNSHQLHKARKLAESAGVMFSKAISRGDLTIPQSQVAHRYLIKSRLELAVIDFAMHNATPAEIDLSKALSVYQASPFTTNFTYSGDELFRLHKYKAAFTAYKASIYNSEGTGLVNPIFVDSGASKHLRLALEAGEKGSYGLALSQALKVSGEGFGLADYIAARAAQAQGKCSVARAEYILVFSSSEPTTSEQPYLDSTMMAAASALRNLCKQS